MPYKNNTKQRNKTIQGLRSFKDTLPTNIKKIIKKKGHIFSEILNNWRYLVGDELFEVCFPKSFKSSNKFSASTLLVMVKRGSEIELEYSRKQIIDKINSYFVYNVAEKLKLVSFDESSLKIKKDDSSNKDVTNNKYMKEINNVRNDKIKKSLIELSKLFKKK